MLVQGWGEDLLGDGGVQVTEVTVNIRSKRTSHNLSSFVRPSDESLSRALNLSI